MLFLSITLINIVSLSSRQTTMLPHFSYLHADPHLAAVVAGQNILPTLLEAENTFLRGGLLPLKNSLIRSSHPSPHRLSWQRSISPVAENWPSASTYRRDPRIKFIQLSNWLRCRPLPDGFVSVMPRLTNLKRFTRSGNKMFRLDERSGVWHSAGFSQELGSIRGIAWAFVFFRLIAGCLFIEFKNWITITVRNIVAQYGRKVNPFRISSNSFYWCF